MVNHVYYVVSLSKSNLRYCDDIGFVCLNVVDRKYIYVIERIYISLTTQGGQVYGFSCEN